MRKNHADRERREIAQLDKRIMAADSCVQTLAVLVPIWERWMRAPAAPVGAEVQMSVLTRILICLKDLVVFAQERGAVGDDVARRIKIARDAACHTGTGLQWVDYVAISFNFIIGEARTPFLRVGETNLSSGSPGDVTILVGGTELTLNGDIKPAIAAAREAVAAADAEYDVRRKALRADS